MKTVILKYTKTYLDSFLARQWSRIFSLLYFMACTTIFGACSDLSKLGLNVSDSQKIGGFQGIGGLMITAEGQHVLAWNFPAEATDVSSLTFQIYMDQWSSMPELITTDSAASSASSSGTVVGSVKARMTDDLAPVRKGVLLGSIKGVRTYTLTELIKPDLIYAFQVRLVDTTGQADNNQEILVYSPAKNVISFGGISMLSLTPEGKPLLSWDAPQMSNGLDPSTVTYDVYMGIAAETPESVIATGTTAIISGKSALAEAATNEDSRQVGTLTELNADKLPSRASSPRAQVKGSTVYLVDQELSTSLTYLFQVQANGSAGLKGNSNRVIVYQPRKLTFAGLPQSGVSLSSNDTSITLKWEPATRNNGTVTYTVYGDANFTTVLGSTSATTYTVSNVVPGQTYTFGVRAKDRSGSDNNQSFAVITVPTPLFKGCTGSTALANKTSVAISYDFPENASSVSLYRGSTSIFTALTPGANVYTDQGLSPGTTYTYLCVASFNGKTINGATTTVTTDGNSIPPIFAGLVSAKVMTNTKISLTWTPSPTTDLQQYNIYLASNLSLRLGSTSESTYVMSGLVPGSTYSFVVRAMNTSGYEERNTVQKTATTLSYTVPDFAGLNAITPAAGVAGLSSLVLSWIPAGGNVTGYRIYMSPTPGGQDFTSPVATVTGITSSGSAASVAGPHIAGQFVTGATVTGMGSNTTSYFVVRAFYHDPSTNSVLTDINQVEHSAKTNSITAPTFAGATGAAQGSGLLALSTATVLWGAPQSNGVWDGFQISYEEGTCAAGFSTSPTTTLASGAGTRSYTVSGLTGNRTYRFRVRSHYSPTNLTDANTTCVQATTTATAPQFAGVSSVTVASGIAGFTQLHVTWPQAIGSFSYYRVEYATNANFTTPSSLAPITQIGTTTAIVTGLTAKTTYYVRVAAVFDSVTPNLTAGTSTVLSASTTPTAPSGEGITSTSVMSSSSVMISWSAPTNGGLYSGYKLWRSCSGTASVDILTAPINDVPYQTWTNTTTLAYTDTGMTSNIQCCYQLRAFYGDGTNILGSQSTTAAQCVTPTLVAPTFAGVSSVVAPVAATGFSKLTVNWNPVSAGEAGNLSCYQISIATTPSGTDWPTDCTSIDDSLKNSTSSSYTVSGLTANTTYYVRVRAINTNGVPPVSNGDNTLLSATTTPKAPTGDNLGTVSGTGFSSIGVTYTPPSGTPSVGGLFNNVFLYVYQGTPSQLSAYKQNVVLPANIGSASFAATLGSGVASLSSAPTGGALIRVPLAQLTTGQANTWIVSGLTTGQQICVMAQAVYWVSGAPNQFLASSISTIKCATPSAVAPTFGGVESVSTPIALTGFTQLNVSWSAITDATSLTNFSYYQVDWATSPTPASWNSTQIATAGTTSYTITGLTANTTYYVRVLAVNNFGSNPVSSGGITIIQGTTTPMAPIGDGLTAASSASPTSIQVTYSAPSATPTSGGLFNNVFLWVYQGNAAQVASYQSGMGIPTSFNGTLSQGTVNLTTPPVTGALIQVPPTAYTTGSVHTWTIAGLTPSQPVCVRAAAVHWVNSQPSLYLPSQTPTTQCATPNATAPSFGGVSSVSGFGDARDFTQMTVNWSAPTGYCTSIDISVSLTAGVTDFTTSSFAASKNLSCDLTSHTIIGLTPGQVYYVQARANNSLCGTTANCRSGEGTELFRTALPTTPVGDGTSSVSFTVVPKAPDTATLTYTLPTSGTWNKIYIWRATAASQTAAIAAVRAAAVTKADYSGPISAPVAQISASAPSSTTPTTYIDSDATLVDGTIYCYLVKAIQTNGIHYHASANTTTHCGLSNYSPLLFAGLATTSTNPGTWSDGTAKIQLNFLSPPSGSVEEYWVYRSWDASENSFDFSKPWQIIDNTTSNPNNPTLNGSFIYAGGANKTAPGTQYFIVRVKHYSGPDTDTNTVVASVTVPGTQANTGLAASSNAVSEGTWSDGTVKIKLSLRGLFDSTVTAFNVYLSNSSDLTTFDFTQPWQVITAGDTTYDRSSNGYLVVGSQGRTFSGTVYFVVRQIYGAHTSDANTQVSHALTILPSEANYVYVSPSMSRLAYGYYIGAYESSISSGSFAANDTVSAIEADLTNCSYRFHTADTAFANTCGTGTSTAKVVSTRGVLPAKATWHQAYVACRNSSGNGVMVRLPTEQEWRRASRWDASNYLMQWTIYSGGAGNCNTASNALGTTGSSTSCVSHIGAYDMAGNTREWVDQRLAPYSISGSGEGRFDYGPTIGRVLANGIHKQANGVNNPITRRYHNITPGANNLALLLGSDYATSGYTYQKQYDAETESWQDPTVSTTTAVPSRGFRCVAWPNTKVMPTMAQLAQLSEPVYSVNDIPGAPNPTAEQAALWKIPENLYVKDIRPETVTHTVTGTIADGSVTISWSPWSKKVCSPSCSSVADTGFTYYIYRYIEPTKIDVRTSVPWAIKAGPYNLLPEALSGANVTGMPMDPLSVNSSGTPICTESTIPCKLVKTIQGSVCNSGAASACTFTDSSSAGTGFDPKMLHDYIMVVKDAEGNHQVPRVQRYRSPYFVGDFSLGATATFRTEMRWRRAAPFLVDEVYQLSGALQSNPQMMVHVPMDQSGLDHDFFIYTYEASKPEFVEGVTNGGFGNLIADQSSQTPTNGACYEQLWRLNTIDTTTCNGNTTTTILQSKKGEFPSDMGGQGDFWKACVNTTIRDGSDNSYRLFLPTDAQWHKAADWGDTAQKGDVRTGWLKANHPSAISNKIATLENGLGEGCRTDLNNSNAAPSGSNDTKFCRSRYGAADMVGNVAEWTTGRTSGSKGLDNGLDGLWLNQTYNTSNYVNFYDILRGIYKGVGAAKVFGNGDYCTTSGSNSVRRGGKYKDGSAAGRWRLEMNVGHDRGNDLGARCVR